jgi:alcohol dehydrogenase (cytochrome c)
VLVALAAGCSGHGSATDWPLPNADEAGTRAVAAGIDAGNVATLHVVWRHRLGGQATLSGLAATTPLVVGDRVYLQDLNSNVLALDRATGKLVWERRFGRQSGGPNGVAYAGGRLYGNTDVAAFALDAHTGAFVWTRQLTTPQQPLTIAPAVKGNLVVTSITGASPGGRGEIVGLDARTGAVRWRWTTIPQPLRHPKVASGGGAWQTPTIDGDGNVWVGTANPNPWGGSPGLPNGGAYPGPLRWTDAVVELDGRTGKLLWARQATPHDVRDYDFQDPPLLTGDLVVGAGKGGRVIAWNLEEGTRAWSTPVGLHRNDVGPLPARPVRVCPGLLGGVETPLALADGRVFAPVVQLCFHESSLGTSLGRFLTTDYAKGRGAFVALDAKTGKRLWSHALASPDFGCATVSHDVVFTSTYAGTLLGYDTETGRRLWRTTVPAAINGCPAVAGKLLVIAAAAAYPEPRTQQNEVVAYAVS